MGELRPDIGVKHDFSSGFGHRGNLVSAHGTILRRPG
jgi:hypothetical protein